MVAEKTFTLFDEIQKKGKNNRIEKPERLKNNEIIVENFNDSFTEGTVREIERQAKPLEASQLERIDRFNQCAESRNIPIKSIVPNPNQPRKEMNAELLKDLTMSIMEYGLLQPIAVRQLRPFEYELIAGHRRLEACKNLGLSYIPAIVICASGTDSAVISLVENIQRENLTYMEEAEAFSALITEHGLTQEKLADKLGKKQSTIANKLRILKLDPEIRGLLSIGGLTERHARALLKLPNIESQKKALNIIIEKGLNVAKSEELIEKILKESPKIEAPPEPEKNIRIFKDVRVFTNTIRQAIDMMRRSGIDATTDKIEEDGYIKYTITIPK
ncbi:MAG: ParB/RepB/Spo0J family partition protein [Oscillospiraceae bacterium]